MSTPSSAVETRSRYLTTEEVAELCRTSPSTVRYWRAKGTGPTAFRLGRRVLYDAAGVESWLVRAAERETSR